MRGVLAGLIALASFAPALPATAEDAPAELRAAVAAAEARGGELYRYDQAAWHATDKFLEGFDRRNAEFMRGYIVLPRDDGLLDTVFFGEVEGKLVEVARYTVNGREVTGGILPETARPPLPDLAIRMAAARTAAVEELRAQNYGLCSRSSANTVVLPPDSGGTITVYILTAPTSNQAYPLGGHYRFEIGPDGKVAASRRFLNSCFDLQASPPPEAGSEAVGLFVSHLLDPQPTEIHAFASRYFPLTVYVGTMPSKLVWEVRDGRIRFLERIADEDAPGTS